MRSMYITTEKWQIFDFLRSEGKGGHQEIMAKVFHSYGIIIVGHFCKRGTIYVSFLEQYIREESRGLKIFNDLQILFEVVLWQEYCIY